APSQAVTPSLGYANVVFADGFESGGLANWDGSPGTGATAVNATSARAGNYGLSLTNTSGQYSFIVKALANPLGDRQTRLWFRPRCCPARRPASAASPAIARWR